MFVVYLRQRKQIFPTCTTNPTASPDADPNLARRGMVPRENHYVPNGRYPAVLGISRDAGIHLHESRLWLRLRRLRPLQHASQAIIRRGSINCSCGTWSADSQANCQDDTKPSIAEMRMLRLLKPSENTAMRPSTPQEGSPVWEPPNLESPIAAQCQHAG
jgi:hypothetical protein